MGIEQDIEVAKYWYTQAAEQGFVPAQSMLGYLYLSHARDDEHRVAAYVWLKRAATAGDADAIQNLAAFRSRLPETVQQRAEQIFRNIDAPTKR